LGVLANGRTRAEGWAEVGVASGPELHGWHRRTRAERANGAWGEAGVAR